MNTPSMSGKALPVLLAVLVPVPGLAQDPHLHGIGKLNLAVEDSRVEIELDSPAANIFGFEHAPGNDRERKTVRTGIQVLEEGERLFRFPATAGCRMVDVDIDTPFGAGPVAQHPGGDHDRHEHPVPDHADVTASYRFECARTAQPMEVSVGLFDAFPATERLEVQFVSPRGQGAATLTAADPLLRF